MFINDYKIINLVLVFTFTFYIFMYTAVYFICTVGINLITLPRQLSLNFKNHTVFTVEFKDLAKAKSSES
jgi:hypothetical protein